jgi:predicted nuclease with RNAse H fold
MRKTWIGIDPGGVRKGVRKFGLAIMKADGSCHTCSVGYVDAAIGVIREHVQSMPAGVGVDAPLWWCSGRGGLRKADQWILDTYNLPKSGQVGGPRRDRINVQAVNSLWGVVLAQGMMFVARIREVFPGVNVTETHPKAVFKVLGCKTWKSHFEALRTDVTFDGQPDDQRDAVISLVAAREGFEGRWKKDLIDDRYPSEQNPSDHWLAPVHYFWPA